MPNTDKTTETRDGFRVGDHVEVPWCSEYIRNNQTLGPAFTGYITKIICDCWARTSWTGDYISISIVEVTLDGGPNKVKENWQESLLTRIE